MHGSPVYRPHFEGPAEARLSGLEPRGPWLGSLAHRFEVVSRGDRVPGRLHRPAPPAQGPFPLVLLVHPAGASKDADALDGAARWVEAGLAVAALDLPLHGDRASPKLSARLLDGVRALARGEALDRQTAVLVEEAARQATSDLLRAHEALAALESIDADRIALVGLGLGAVLVCYALAHDRGLRCAVLAGGGGGGAGDLDPARWLPKSSTEELLFLLPEDERPEAAATRPEGGRRALVEAAPGSARRSSRFRRHEGVWPAEAWDAMQHFLIEHLAR